MIILIPYINLSNLSSIKMFIFEEYGAFKMSLICADIFFYLLHYRGPVILINIFEAVVTN